MAIVLRSAGCACFACRVLSLQKALPARGEKVPKQARPAITLRPPVLLRHMGLMRRPRSREKEGTRREEQRRRAAQRNKINETVEGCGPTTNVSMVSQSGSTPATKLQHSAHFRDRRCQKRRQRVPKTAPLAPRRPRDREPLFLGLCSQMPRNLTALPIGVEMVAAY